MTGAKWEAMGARRELAGLGTDGDGWTINCWLLLYVHVLCRGRSRNSEGGEPGRPLAPSIWRR